MSRLWSVVFFFAGMPILSQTVFDVREDYPIKKANRDEIRIGKEKDGVFFADDKPTDVSEEDKKWMKMTMKPGWTYLRNTSSTIDGKGYVKTFFIDTEIYIKWVAEVAWTSHILYNDGEKIIEFRSYMPQNRISLLQSAVELKCAQCIKAGGVLKEYAKAWKGSESDESLVATVKTVIGELISFTGNQLENAKTRMEDGKATRYIEKKSHNLKILFRDSLFSNKHYLIQYNLTRNQPDKLIRLEREGDGFTRWVALGSPKQDVEEENLRRQALVRSAYLMDVAVLPKDKEIEEGEKWTVPAQAFGQVVGNDLASDLKEINGSVSLRREKDIKKSNMIHIVKTGSSLDNRIKFQYVPEEEGSTTEVHKSLTLDPESLNLFFDTENNHIRKVLLQGKALVSMAKNIQLWPDVDLTAEPYVEARYESEVLDKNFRENRLSKQAYENLRKLVHNMLGTLIDMERSEKINE